MNANVLKKMGAFFSYGELRLGQGREAAKEFLRQNPDLAREIEDLIKSGAEAPRAEFSRNGNGGGSTAVLEGEPEDEG